MEKLYEDEVVVLKEHLSNKMLQELHVLAKDVDVRLAGLSHQADILD